MADDKKNIPDAGKVDDLPSKKSRKVEPVKADSPLQDQPAPAQAEAPVIEDASKVVTPPAAEQSLPEGKQTLKDKNIPTQSKAGALQSGKEEKQTATLDMRDPPPHPCGWQFPGR